MYVLQDITIEPSLIISNIVICISTFANKNLQLQKLCYANDTGPNPGVICPNEVAVQKEAALLNSYEASIETSIKFVVIIFSSLWRGNPRGLLIYSLIGYIGMASVGVLSLYFWNSSVWFLVVGSSVLGGLTGSEIFVHLCPTLYITKISGESTRTFRIGILTGIYYLCQPIGAYLAGFINVRFGFYPMFIMSIVGNTVSIILLMFLMKLPKEKEQKTLEGYDNKIEDDENMNTNNTCVDKKKITQSEDINDEVTHTNGYSTKQNIALNDNNMKTNEEEHKKISINPVILFINNVKVLIKPRDNSRTKITILIMITQLLVIGALEGEYAILYYYVRHRFGWTESEFGFYASLKLISSLWGILFSMGLLSRILKFKDTSLGFLAGVSDIIGSTLYIFASTPIMMYIVPFLDIFHGSVIVLCSSIITKMVSPEDLHQVLSVKYVFEGSIPISIKLLYNLIYRTTVSYWPPAFFAFSVLISIPPLVVFCYVHLFLRRLEKSSNKVLI